MSMTIRSPIRRSRGPGRAASGGFSLIEVLIALVVLAVGLLGVAMMQMMSLRFTQSANHRTMATNLAYELIDLARSNRDFSANYIMTYAEFGDPDTSGGCERSTAADPDSNLERWKCEVRASLPEGEAAVSMPGEGVIQVDIRWADAHWVEDVDEQDTAFTVVSRI